MWLASGPGHKVEAAKRWTRTRSIMATISRRLRSRFLPQPERFLSLPRLAAICSRCGATVSWTNAPFGFVNARVVPIGAVRVLDATGCVADCDPIAGQVAVLSNECDCSATGTVNLWHLNLRERAPDGGKANRVPAIDPPVKQGKLRLIVESRRL
jgi:hypothetical protein